jgi:hypothetical protein
VNLIERENFSGKLLWGDINLGKVKEAHEEGKPTVRLQARSHTKGKLRQAALTDNSGKPLWG